MRNQSSRIAPGARRTGSVAAILTAAALGVGIAGCSDDETEDAINKAKEGLSTAEEELQKGLDEAEKEVQSKEAKKQLEEAEQQADEQIEEAQKKLDEQSNGGY
jgi:uncharacterized protein HemX